MSPRSRRAVLAYVLVLVAFLCAAPSTVSAAFTSSVPTATSDLTSDTSFPAYDAAVAGGGTVGTSPFAYYRSDEAASAATTSTAADSSTNARAGTYPTPTDGPLLTWSFGDGAGTRAYDSSGAVNTGTLTGGAASTATGGHLGGAMSFAAASGSVAAPRGDPQPRHGLHDLGLAAGADPAGGRPGRPLAARSEPERSRRRLPHRLHLLATAGHHR